VGTNSAGTAFGSDLAFTTLAGPPPPQISGLAVLSSGAQQLTFSNLAGASFTVLATTNLASPISQWSTLGVPIEVSPGQYEFTDQEAPNYPQRFYIIRSP
jgi:hypothetical protein